MIRHTKKILYLGLGWLFFAIGFIGIFVPLLPTTPFMLLAAGCFSRGSQRIYNWLLAQPKIGPAIIDWQDNRVIRPRAKLMATIAIVITFSIPIGFVDVSVTIKGIVFLIGVSVLGFILTRKSA